MMKIPKRHIRAETKQKVQQFRHAQMICLVLSLPIFSTFPVSSLTLCLEQQIDVACLAETVREKGKLHVCIWVSLCSAYIMDIL